MKRISAWAKHHSLAARICITVIKIILVWMAWVTGNGLQELNLYIPGEICAIVALVLLLIVLLYPSNKTGRTGQNRSYAFRKSCDFMLSACSFLLIVTIVNTGFLVGQTSSSYASTTALSSLDKRPTAEEILQSLKTRDKHSLTRQEKRILKKEFNQQLKNYIKAKITRKKEAADKALLIMLTIIGAVGLMYLLAALVCTLSCNGAEAAAVILAIIGAAGIIVGTVLIINRISNPRRRRIKNTSLKDAG